MSIRVNRDQVTAMETRYATSWRHIRRDGPHHVGVGIAEFKPRIEDVDYPSIAESHDVPEVHYVLSGQGILFEEGESIPLRMGDAVITPAGRAHVLWAVGSEPLVTVYVAVGRDAFDPPAGS